MKLEVTLAGRQGNGGNSSVSTTPMPSEGSAAFKEDRSKRLERWLLQLPEVLDCAVLTRLGGFPGDGERTLAYVVTSGGAGLGLLQESVVAQDPEAARSLTLISVSALPLDGEGAVDRGALEAVPVLDRAISEHCIRAIASAGSVDSAEDGSTAVIQPSRKRVPRAVPGEPMQLSKADGADPARSRVGSAPPSILVGGTGLEREDLQLIGDALSRAAESAPEQGFVFVHGDGGTKKIAYPELLERSSALGRGLRSAGLQPGDEVLLQLRHTEDFLCALWGVIAGGFVAVPLAFAPNSENPVRSASLLETAWQLGRRPVILTSRGSVDQLRQLGAESGTEWSFLEIEQLAAEGGDLTSPPRSADDTSILLLTSGSTGAPKGVTLSHRNLLSSVLGSAHVNRFSSEEVSLNWLPLSHIGALMRSLREVVLGATQIQMKTREVLEDPLRWLDAMDRFRVTTSWAPNFAFSLVVEQGDRLRGRSWDFSPLRSLWTSGESIAPTMMRRFQELLEPYGLTLGDLHTAWGMTEACFATFSHDYMVSFVKNGQRFPDVGHPIPGVSMRIVDEKGRVVPEGVEGSLQIEGPVVTKGYVQPEAERESRTADGWLDTGDLGTIEQGRLTISGRKKDVIIVNGVNYSPREVESLVEEIDGVDRAFTAACGVRAASSDTDALAIFFHPLVEKEALEGLFATIRDRVARGVGLSPTYLVPVERREVPKTPVGKIQRSVLRKQFVAGAFEGKVRVYGAAGRTDATMLPAWLYRRVWRPRPLVIERTSQPGRTVLFVEPGPLGRALAATVEERLGPCVVIEDGDAFEEVDAGRYRVDLADRARCRRLIGELLSDGKQIERIIYALACSIPAPPGDAARAERWPERAVRAFLEPLRALMDHPGRSSSVRLLVAVTGAQAVEPDDVQDPGRTALAGLARTLLSEVMELPGRLVDLEPADPEEDAALLLEELLDPRAEPEVAYRGRRRLVARLQKTELQPREQPRELFARGGHYLVCGHLDGLGERLSRFLAERFDARVALVGIDAAGAGREVSVSCRSGLNGSQAEDDQGPGVVEPADPESLERLIGRFEDRWGASLDGVVQLTDLSLGPSSGLDSIHVLDDGSVDSLRRAFEEVETVERIADRRPTASFVRVAAVAGAFGEPGSGSKAVTAGLLQALDHDRRRRGSPSRLLLVAPLDEKAGVGSGSGGVSVWDRRGFIRLDPEGVLRSMLWTLAHPEEEGPWLVGVDGRSPARRRLVEGDLHGGEELVAYLAREGKVSGDRGPALVDRFGTPTPYRVARTEVIPDVELGSRLGRAPSTSDGAAPSASDQSVAEAAVSRAFSQALGFERVARDENFFELGGGSLHVLRAVGRLRAAFPERTVSSAELFRYPTVAELAAHLEGTSQDGSEVARGRQRAGARRRLRSRKGRGRQ